MLLLSDRISYCLSIMVLLYSKIPFCLFHPTVAYISQQKDSIVDGSEISSLGVSWDNNKMIQRETKSGFFKNVHLHPDPKSRRMPSKSSSSLNNEIAH